MARKKKEDPYDLCACYEPAEPVPEEFIEPGDREPTMAESALYMRDEDGIEYYCCGIEYYCCGNTRIKITESFPEKGPSMNELLTDLIIRESKKDS